MRKQFTIEDRARLAKKIGVSAAGLYQALSGTGYGYKPEKCVELERLSGGELRRWDLRPKDWHLIWPELIGAVGAPPIEQPAQA